MPHRRIYAQMPPFAHAPEFVSQTKMSGFDRKRKCVGEILHRRNAVIQFDPLGLFYSQRRAVGRSTVSHFLQNRAFYWFFVTREGWLVQPAPQSPANPNDKLPVVFLLMTSTTNSGDWARITHTVFDPAIVSPPARHPSVRHFRSACQSVGGGNRPPIITIHSESEASSESDAARSRASARRRGGTAGYPSSYVSCMLVG